MKNPEQFFKSLLELSGDLIQSVDVVANTCSSEDAALYRAAIAQTLCTIFTRTICPVLKLYPSQLIDPARPMKRPPMIGDIETARTVSDLMFTVSKSLTTSLEIGQKLMETEEYKSYAKGIGASLTDIMYEILNPIFARHPSIEPKDWK